jgi:hypothetical protein
LGESDIVLTYINKTISPDAVEHFRPILTGRALLMPKNNESNFRNVIYHGQSVVPNTVPQTRPCPGKLGKDTFEKHAEDI